MCKISLIVVPCLVVAAASCGTPDVKISDHHEYDERVSERSRRMNIRIVDSDGIEREYPHEEFFEDFGSGEGVVGEEVNKWCAGELVDRYRVPADVGQYLSSCDSAVFEMMVRECKAELLMDVALADAPTRIGAIVFMPQLVEAKTVLLKGVLYFSGEIVVHVGESVRTGFGNSLAVEEDWAVATDCGVSEWAKTWYNWYEDGSAIWRTSDVLIGDILAKLLVDGSHRAERAGREFARLQHAIAEAELSRTTSMSIATRLSWLDPDLSRSAAARFLLGGHGGSGYGFGGGGMFGYDEAGPCPMPEPDEETRAAAGLLRATGAPADLVMDLDIPLDHLVLGGGLVSAANALQGRFDLLGSTFPVAEASDVPSVLQLLGTNADAIQRARSYLHHENRAFARDTSVLVSGGIPLGPDALLNPRVLPGVSAATLRAARGIPGAFSNARVRFADRSLTTAGLDQRADLGEGPLPPNVSSASLVPVTARGAAVAPSVVSIVDYALSIATDFASLDPLDLPPSWLMPPPSVLDELGRFATGNVERRPHRTQVCVLGTGATNEVIVDTLVTGIDTGALRIVRGASGLRCATEGNVEGERCQMGNDTPGVLTFDVTNAIDKYQFTASNAERMFGARLAAGVRSVAQTVDPNDESPNAFVFVVAPRPGVNNPGPGDYIGIGGTRLLPPTVNDGSTYEYCVVQPYMPEYEELAGEMLEMSGRWCARSETTCAGPRFSDRIPLENELTDDGNAIENSWRHYLDSATRAAERADRLGEELLGAGAIIDENAEIQADALREICGERIDLGDAFWELLDEGPGAACTCLPDESCPACGAGRRCDSGLCVVDLEAYISARAETDDSFRALQRCISSDSVIDYVAAGSRPLCAWKLSGDSHLCGDPMIPDTRYQCPWVVAGECQVPFVASGSVPVLISERLRIFESQTQPTAIPPADTVFDCDKIREYRAATNPEQQARLGEEVARAGIFGWEKVQEYARRISYRAMPDDYAAITLDGRPWRSTGDYRAGAAAVTEWPCVPVTSSHCGATDGPWSGALFCASAGLNACSDEPLLVERRRRAAMNHRMGRAVMALKIATGASLDSMRVAYVPDPYSLTVEADRERNNNDFASIAWRFDGSSGGGTSPPALRSGVTFGRSNEVIYDILEFDNNRNDRGEHPKSGEAFCTEGDAVIWTHVGSEAWVAANESERDAAMTELRAHCNTSGVPSTNGYAPLAVAFANPGVGAAIRTDSLPGEIWSGMGPNGPESRNNDEYASRIKLYLVDPIGARSPGGHVAIGGWPLVGRSLCSIISDQSGLPEARRSTWRCTSNPLSSAFESDAYNRVSLFGQRREVSGLGAGSGQQRKILDPLVLGPVGRREMIDALELLCEVTADDFEQPDAIGGTRCGDWEAMGQASLTNMREAQRLMECLAEEFLSEGERSVFANLPRAVVDARGGTGAGVGGSRGDSVEQVVAELEEIAQIPRLIGSSLKGIAGQLRLARNELQRNELSQDIIGIEQFSLNAREASSCIAANLNGAASSIEGGLGASTSLRMAAATVTCANSIVQIALGLQRGEIERRILDVDTDSALTRISMEMQQLLDTVQGLASRATAASARLRGALARMESQRNLVLDQLQNVLVTYGNTSATATNRRRRYNTALIRYREAHEHAVRSAWLARRALEQRLGISLDDLDDDMYLVEAPSRWANELCTLQGLDYRRISREQDLPGDSYAREYLGDYVERLRAVFESYSHDFPFSDGEDIAVVSVRDDIVRPTGAPCSVAVRNLLAYSSDLHRRWDPDYVRPEIESIPIPGTDESEAIPMTFEERFGPPVWARLGCTPDPTTQIVGGCVETEPLDQGLPAVFEGSEAAYRVVFGRPGIPLPGETDPHGSWTTDARVAQTLTLPAGRYRMSWYGRSPSIAGMFPIGPAGAVVVTDEFGNPAGTQSATHSVPDVGDWSRYFRFVELGADTVVEVAIPTMTPTPLDPNGQPMSPMVVDLGGLMLEEVSAQVPAVASLPAPSMDAFPYPPRTLVATRAAGYAELPFCEDPTGTNFRSRWRRGCERLCPAGPGTCSSGGRVACYWELPITIGLEDLETGIGKLRQARFAYGNYNYRWSQVGVNLVGTGLRDCAGVGSPSTCYGGGFAPFSIHHNSGDMGFPVRNHRGDAYLAPVFEGRVEHARALVAERYLTNPISGADRSLIEPYMRTELRGRPLAGSYLLRIWEDEAFDWSRLEDVQLVMGYRYWTRLR